MSGNKEDSLNSKPLPFFARFLEGQFSEELEDLSEEEMSEVQGGLKIAKRPINDIPDGGIVVTLRYPSDVEDGHVPSPPISHPISKKYPSDCEEIAVTMKYPSDGDDYIATTPISSSDLAQ